MIRRTMMGLVLAICLPALANADLSSYSQDFEGMSQSDPNALANDSWIYFINAFPGIGGYYNYTGPAPNGPQISNLETGEGGPNQGNLYLNVYTDYANGDMDAAGNNYTLENNVFQQQVVGAADVGITYDFFFDYKASSMFGPAGNTDTIAFIKVLDPANGFADVVFPTNINTTLASTSVWSEGNSLSVTIDNAWIGHVFQFGFSSTVNNFENSGVYYDNISFGERIPEPTSVAFIGLGLIGVAMRRRRK